MTCCPKCSRLGIFRHGSLAIFALVLAAGCLAPGKDPNLQGSAQKMPVVGDWSEQSAGLRCRMRLLSTHFRETESIPAALEVANDSGRAVDVDLSSREQPSLIWSVGPTLLLSRSDPRQTHIRVAPKQTREIAQAWLAIPPAVNPR